MKLRPMKMRRIGKKARANAINDHRMFRNCYDYHDKSENNYYIVATNGFDTWCIKQKAIADVIYYGKGAGLSFKEESNDKSVEWGAIGNLGFLINASQKEENE